MDDARRIREQVTLGVDTHAELHVAAALDERGRLLGTCAIPTTSTGFADLLHWVDQYGALVKVGMEGTGSYGAGFARWLRARHIAVIEVDRPDRRTRRRRGKSDSVDAEAAARAVLAGTAAAQPKAGTGAMEMVRTLRVGQGRPAVPADLHGTTDLAPVAGRLPGCAAHRRHRRRAERLQLTNLNLLHGSCSLGHTGTRAGFARGTLIGPRHVI
jgi:transposase